MWICLNNAFFSIVDAKRPDGRLVVRARRKGDIERVFERPGVYSPGRDYAYRVFLERDEVAAVVMGLVLGIDYGNFKSSVKDGPLHDAYMRVWGVMGDLQVGGPYGRRPERAAPRKASAKGRQRSLPMGTTAPFPVERDPDMDGLAFVQPRDVEIPFDISEVDAGFGVAMTLDELEALERQERRR